MALINVEAIVIRVRDLGEADKIVTLFSREEGKLAAVARGARRPRNRLAAAAQIFTHCHAALFPSRSLGTLSQVEIRDTFRHLREDLLRMAYATYMCELVDEFLGEKDQHEDVFLLLLATLHLLTDGATDPEPLLHAFELKLLAQLGYRPVLTQCAGCGQAVPGSPVRFSPLVGGIVCGECRPESGALIQVSRGTVESMRLLLEGDLRRTHILRLSPESAQEMDGLLEAYVELRLERRLRSRRFLQSLRGQS